MRCHVLLLATLLAAAVPTAASAREPDPPSAEAVAPIAGEDAVFARFLAPCCWQQTLDVHASAEASALRDEIRARLRAGESRERIEAALVDRYGARIVAAPTPERLAWLGPLSFAVAAGVFGVFLARVLRRPRPQPRAESRAARQDEAALDRRIDADLADMEA